MKEIVIALILILSGIGDVRDRNVRIIYQILLISLIPFGFRISNLWGAVIAVPFFIAAYYGGIGGGDVKAVLILGILTGLKSAYITVLLACTIFVAVSKITELAKKQKNMEFPIMPYLAAGYILQLLWEVYLI